MKKHLSLFIILSLWWAPRVSNAQLIRPFKIKHQVITNGSIAMVANTSLGCSTVQPACSAATDLPPTSSLSDNGVIAVHLDIDADATTFNSTSDSLNLPNCSEILYAAIFWGGHATAITPGWTTRNQIKLNVDGTGYQIIAADTSWTNTAGFTTYHCSKDITSIVRAGGIRSRLTVANVVANVGVSNRFASWNIIVVYRNDLLPTRQLTVFEGLSNVTTTPTDINVSGFVTPLSGPVTFEIGMYVHDGDRGLGGDSLLFRGGAGGFVPILDAINNGNNIFNSTISRGGVMTPFRLPNYNNLLSLDADIFIPNNVAKIYITNGDTSMTLRQKTGGETYLTQAATLAVDIYAPVLNPPIRVQDVNGGSVVPGDTLIYTIMANNTGTEVSENTFITDTLVPILDYVPGSMVVTFGPNAGAKTDTLGDDQAEYLAAIRTIRVRIGAGADASLGGVVNPSSMGADSTVITFRVVVTSSCALLACHDNVATNLATAFGLGQYSGNQFMNTSVPRTVGSTGCSFSVGGTTSVVIGPCPVPGDTAIMSCANQPLLTLFPNLGYDVFANSSFDPVTSPAGPGVYYAFNHVYPGCTDTAEITIIWPDTSAGPDVDICPEPQDALLGGTQVGNPYPAGSVTYQWSPPTYLNSTTVINPTAIAVNSPITYTLTTSFDGCVTTDQVNVTICLPVEQVHLAAQQAGSVVQLTWISSHEVNVERYAVERSADGRDWNLLAETAASNLLDTTSSYAEVDGQPQMGTNLYRLRIIDLDGHTAFSNIAEVNFSRPDWLTFAPNPSEGIVSLDVELTMESTILVKVLGTDGRCLFSERFAQRSPGQHHVEIDLRHLPDGIYLLDVSTAQGKRRERLVKGG